MLLCVDIMAAVVHDGGELQEQALAPVQAVHTFHFIKDFARKFTDVFCMMFVDIIDTRHSPRTGERVNAHMFCILISAFGDQHLLHQREPEVYLRRDDMIRFDKLHQTHIDGQSGIEKLCNLLFDTEAVADLFLGKGTDLLEEAFDLFGFDDIAAIFRFNSTDLSDQLNLVSCEDKTFKAAFRLGKTDAADDGI